MGRATRGAFPLAHGMKVVPARKWSNHSPLGLSMPLPSILNPHPSADRQMAYPMGPPLPSTTLVLPPPQPAINIRTTSHRAPRLSRALVLQPPTIRKILPSCKRNSPHANLLPPYILRSVYEKLHLHLASHLPSIPTLRGALFCIPTFPLYNQPSSNLIL